MAIPINEIPPGNVGQVVQSLISNDGVTHIDVAKQADGTYIVTPIQQSFAAFAKSAKGSTAKRRRKGS